jgi:hypothetical protein
MTPTKTKTIAEATGEDDVATTVQIRNREGIRAEVETGADTRGGTRTATKVERRTDPKDQGTIGKAIIEGATTVTETTRDLTIEVDGGASLTLDLGQDQDHRAASHTANATGHARARLDFRNTAQRHRDTTDDDRRVQRLTRTHSKPSLALFHLHLNQLCARAVEVSLTVIRWASSLASLQTMIHLWT